MVFYNSPFERVEKPSLFGLCGPFLDSVGPFRLLLLSTCPLTSTAPGGGVHGGLLEGSWRRLRGMRDLLNVGIYAPAS